MRDLTDKVAVIFAATGAIAGAVSKSLARNGVKVYVTGTDWEAIQSLVKSIQQKKGWARGYKVDALNEKEIDNVMREVIKEAGKVDIVFNGIGIRPSQSQYGVESATITYENFLKPITTIVGSQFLTSKIAAKYMAQTGTEGTIVTLTSSLSRSKNAFMAGITAASSAIEGMTLSLAAEFEPMGIKVVCINSSGIMASRTIQETFAAIGSTTRKDTMPAKTEMPMPNDSIIELKQLADTITLILNDEHVAAGDIIDVDFDSSGAVYHIRSLD